MSRCRTCGRASITHERVGTAKELHHVHARPLVRSGQPMKTVNIALVALVLSGAWGSRLRQPTLIRTRAPGPAAPSAWSPTSARSGTSRARSAAGTVSTGGRPSCSRTSAPATRARSPSATRAPTAATPAGASGTGTRAGTSCTPTSPSTRGGSRPSPATDRSCQRKHTITHEFGHVLGLRHYRRSHAGSVMSYLGWQRLCGGLTGHDRSDYRELFPPDPRPTPRLGHRATSRARRRGAARPRGAPREAGDRPGVLPDDARRRPHRLQPVQQPRPDRRLRRADGRGDPARAQGPAAGARSCGPTRAGARSSTTSCSPRSSS